MPTNEDSKTTKVEPLHHFWPNRDNSTQCQKKLSEDLKGHRDNLDKASWFRTWQLILTPSGDTITHCIKSFFRQCRLSIWNTAKTHNEELMQWLKNNSSAIKASGGGIVITDFYEFSPRFVEKIISFNTTDTPEIAELV